MSNIDELNDANNLLPRPSHSDESVLRKAIKMYNEQINTLNEAIAHHSRMTEDKKQEMESLIEGRESKIRKLREELGEKL